jgi:hypothetical protein
MCMQSSWDVHVRAHKHASPMLLADHCITCCMASYIDAFPGTLCAGTPRRAANSMVSPTLKAPPSAPTTRARMPAAPLAPATLHLCAHLLPQVARRHSPATISLLAASRWQCVPGTVVCACIMCTGLEKKPVARFTNMCMAFVVRHGL